MAESILNAIQINEATGDIVIACGATGYFKVEIETDGEFNTETDVGVFAVGKNPVQDESRRIRPYYADIILSFLRAKESILYW